jgi:hypothetical protein
MQAALSLVYLAASFLYTRDLSQDYSNEHTCAF